MLFRRMAQSLDEEIKNGNKWIKFCARNGAESIGAGLIIWVVLMLPLFFLLPDRYCVPPYSTVIFFVWLALFVSAMVIHAIILRRRIKGFYYTNEIEPGRLNDKTIKKLAYFVAIVPVYLWVALVLAAMIFVFYKIIRGEV